MTPPFRALFVDDEERPRAKAIEAAEGDDRIVVRVASSKAEALELIADEFFNVAIVDLELERSKRRLAEGRDVLRALKVVRPTCKRILCTKYATDMPAEVFELLRPITPIIDAAIDKEDLGGSFHQYLRAAAQLWDTHPVEIVDLDVIFDWLSAKSIRGREITGLDRLSRTTIEELHFVLAGLFGDLFRGGESHPDDVGSVTFEAFTGGKSRSIVLFGRPRNRLDEPGLLCVVKVGSRKDTEEELRRYDRFVKFRVALKDRVELLGQVVGDTLGAIAYSFAGVDPDHVRDLQSLLDTGDPRAEEQLDQIFDHAAWRALADDGDDIGQFFNNAYRLRPREVRRSMAPLIDDWATEHSWHHRGDEIRIGDDGAKLVLPDDDVLGAGILHASYRSSIVHGDFNASNVIIADTGERILIDYRHTSRGPRGLDYAAMHASVRMSQIAKDRSPSKVIADERREYALWQHDWSRPDSWWPTDRAGQPPAWLSAAARLMALTHKHCEDLPRAEYAATCWLYAMRVFRVTDLEREAKLRLLIWISALNRVIVDEERATTAGPGLS